MRRWLRVPVVALLVAACSESTPPQPIEVQNPVATVADLVGPWRPTPLQLDPVMRRRIELACRGEIPVGPGAQVAVIDARGASVVTVRMSGQESSSCDALEVQANGTLLGAGGGWSGGREQLGQPRDGTVGLEEWHQVLGGNLKARGWSVTGRVGRGIARVDVVPSNHPIVSATLENGWYAAWWPAAAGDPWPEQGRYPDTVVRGYDEAGALLWER